MPKATEHTRAKVSGNSVGSSCPVLGPEQHFFSTLETLPSSQNQGSLPVTLHHLDLGNHERLAVPARGDISRGAPSGESEGMAEQIAEVRDREREGRQRAQCLLYLRCLSLSMGENLGWDKCRLLSTELGLSGPRPSGISPEEQSHREDGCRLPRDPSPALHQARHNHYHCSNTPAHQVSTTIFTV